MTDSQTILSITYTNGFGETLTREGVIVGTSATHHKIIWKGRRKWVLVRISDIIKAEEIPKAAA